MNYNFGDDYEKERHKMIDKQNKNKKSKTTIRINKKIVSKIDPIGSKKEKAKNKISKNRLVSFISLLVFIFVMTGLLYYILNFSNPNSLSESNKDDVKRIVGEIKNRDSDSLDDGKEFLPTKRINWALPSKEEMKNMTSSDIKYLSLELNLLSKIERIEREKGILSDVNPYIDETYDEYITRIGDKSNSLDIQGLYYNLYIGREKIDNWIFSYLKAKDILNSKKHKSKDSFFNEYIENYFKGDKNNLGKNKGLDIEIREYISKTYLTDNGFIFIPLKDSFINHKEDYTKLLPKNITEYKGRDDSKDGKITFEKDSVQYTFAQDEDNGNVYIVRARAGSEDKNPINTMNRWENKSFYYFEENVKSSKIDIEYLVSKGYT